MTQRRKGVKTGTLTFNLLKGGEFTPAQLAHRIQALVAERDDRRAPSDATTGRDVECIGLQKNFFH